MVGESGVGKTRLVDELAARARAGGARVLRGDCVQLGEGELAYAPLVSALRPLARDGDPVLTGLGPEVLAELGTLLPGIAAARRAGRAPGRAGARLRGAARVLDGLSREQPLLLIIEDLHWADASTRAFLRFLAAALGHEPLLVVATYRPDELHRRHPLRPLVADLERTRALRVDLGGFTREELALQLEGILGTEPDAALVDRLFARSEGNPLFAEELLAAGVDGRGAVPPSLADALALRIERLSPDAQELVRVLSAGGTLGDAVLGEVTGMEPRALRDALREAVASHIVVPRGRLLRAAPRAAARGRRTTTSCRASAPSCIWRWRGRSRRRTGRSTTSGPPPSPTTTTPRATSRRRSRRPSGPGSRRSRCRPTARAPRCSSARWSCGTGCRTPGGSPA